MDAKHVAMLQVETTTAIAGSNARCARAVRRRHHLQDSLVVQAAKRLAVCEAHGHVLVRHDVHGGLQGDLPVFINPPLSDIVQLPEADELAPPPLKENHQALRFGWCEE